MTKKNIVFSELNIHSSIQDAIAQMKWKDCTPIQAQTLPLSLQGYDVAGKAQTGTGKTAAFLIAVFNYLMTNPVKPKETGPWAVILAPTRELAVQIYENALEIGCYTGLKPVAIYGGKGYEEQKAEFINQQPDIIIGTPGRIIDLFKQRLFSLKNVDCLVLDEADRMFDLGFLSDIRFLLKQMPEAKKRLNLIFSATFNYRVQELAYEHLNSPKLIEIQSKTQTAKDITQSLYQVANSEKIPLLIGQLVSLKPKKSLVFVNTKHTLEKIVTDLTKAKFKVAFLSGDVAQDKREKLLKQFQDGGKDILVATDVAARGLHIDNVTHVFNYDLPQNPEDYIHRIGRTARAGKSGVAISYSCENYAYHLPEIEDLIKVKIPSVAVKDEMLVTVAQKLKLTNKSVETKKVEKIERKKSEEKIMTEKESEILTANPVLLMILDGWGNSLETNGNAILNAKTPVWDKLTSEHSTTEIATSGSSVGLPDGQMGNSEVGHMNIGAGRIVHQSLSRIENAIKEHSFNETKALTNACNVLDGKSLHIMGLVSSGGVHSHMNHIKAMINLAKQKKVKNIYLHAFLDGRDVAPRSAKEFLAEFEKLEDDNFKIATIVGRYYAMDRDNNWDRVSKAYQVIVENKSEFKAKTSLQAIEDAYARDENDEFVKPCVLEGAKPMQDGDNLIFMNFRADRAREVAQAFYYSDFKEFEAKKVKLTSFTTLTKYQAELNTQVAFPPIKIKNSLGEVVSNKGLNQLRIAETEKYAHVTYFFNGGEEKVFKNEDRELIASPKVATYDLQPEMSAPEVTEKLVAAIKSKKYSFICVNFANPDMVGHTGIMEAAIKAIEAVDKCVGKVVNAAKSNDFSVLITADHGNAEQMINYKTGKVMTSHTTNPVPLILINKDAKTLKEGGALCDLAPSILSLMGVDKPKEMTGKSLIK